MCGGGVHAVDKSAMWKEKRNGPSEKWTEMKWNVNINSGLLIRINIYIVENAMSLQSLNHYNINNTPNKHNPTPLHTIPYAAVAAPLFLCVEVPVAAAVYGFWLATFPAGE